MGTEMSAVVTVGAERIHRRRKEQARTAGGAVGGGRGWGRRLVLGSGCLHRLCHCLRLR